MIFLLPRGLMRDIHAVVGIDRIDMLDVWHDCSMSGVIAFQFVGVEPAGLAPLPFDQATKEADRGLLIVSSLHQDINGVPILIDRTPQILMLPVNGDDDFIEMPGIAQLALPFFQSAHIRRSKLQTPAPYRLVGHEPITNRRLEIISEPLSQWGIKKPDEFFVIFQWEKSREERTFTRKIINLDIGVKSSLRFVMGSYVAKLCCKGK